MNFLTGMIGVKIDAVKLDILVNDEFDQGAFGIPGKVLHTLGHSASSISVLLNNGEALVGDLIRQEKQGVIGLGMFYQDRVVALESLRKISHYNPRIIYLSHGDAIEGKRLKEYLDTIQ